MLGREDARVEVKVPICFYDVLADHFYLENQHENPILALIVQLWSQPFASHIFALLTFYSMNGYLKFNLIVQMSSFVTHQLMIKMLQTYYGLISRQTRHTSRVFSRIFLWTLHRCRRS